MTDTITVRAVGYPNALITDYPVAVPQVATADTIYLKNMGSVDILAADGVLANDLPDPLSLTALLDTPPGVGTLDPNPDPSGLNPDGSFTYTYK